MAGKVAWLLAGAGAIGGTVGLIYALTRHDIGGGCGAGYFPCEGGACCPDGDVCAESNGSCATGSSKDPANPGCCIPACPGSCTADSQCASCGAGFLCEGGECTKQVPSQILVDGASVVSAEPTLSVEYYGTCCGIFSACCNLMVIANEPTPVLTITVLDAYGEPVPGVCVGGIGNEPWSSDYWTVNLISSGGTCENGDPMTDENGQITFTIESTGTPPPGYQGADDFPCDACSTQPGTGTFGVPAGQFVISLPDYPGVPEATVAVTIAIDYAGYWLQNCSCF
jgi:hypothetical protein